MSAISVLDLAQLPFAPTEADLLQSRHSSYTERYLLLLGLAQLAGLAQAQGSRRGTLTNRSGTSDGSSKTVAEANTARSFFLFQNPSGNSGTMWVRLDGAAATAASPAVEVKPGQGFKWDGS